MKVGKKELTIIPRWITVKQCPSNRRKKVFRNGNVIISNSKIRSTRRRQAPFSTPY